MGPFDPQMIQAMVQRELAQPQPMVGPSIDLGLPAAPDTGALSPGLLAALGAGADIAGTYAGMKAKGDTEDNSMLAGMKPAGVAAGLGAQFAGQAALGALVKKLFPKAKPAVDAVNANTGARQLGLGSSWLRVLRNDKASEGGFKQVSNVLNRGMSQAARKY